MRASRVDGIVLMFLFSAAGLCAQPSSSSDAAVIAGRHTFLTRCATCHGTGGNGGEFGPSILDRVRLRTDDGLIELLHNGQGGMPAFPGIGGVERSNLVTFLRTLKPLEGSASRSEVKLVGGGTLEGVVLNKSISDMQMLGADHRLHLLRKTAEGEYREVTSQVDWPNYDGGTLGDRYSPVKQITPANVASLQSKWIFTFPNNHDLEVTPVVVEGVMYVTSANECYALDAGSGRQIWHYRRQRTKGITGISASGGNRGAAVSGDRVFMATDNAHVIALSRFTGALLWDTVEADWHQNYNATSAPLAVGNMVVAGIAGGDDGARGFLAAYDQATGKELWRFWTVPKPGEPGSETWKGTALAHPGGSTWMSGQYDPETDTLFWPVGNPGPDMIGEQRLGDNLYTDSVLALEPKTGKLKWYFQFTPHDVHDYDAMTPAALIDATWHGEPRKLLVQASRNGYLYVLDRTSGKFLMGTQYATKLTWATGLTPEGRPIVAPGKEPTHEGTVVCPWLNGASNWYSTSYNPLTQLYYVQTNDKCGIFTRVDMDYKQGRGYMGGSFGGDPNDEGQRLLRAFNIQTGQPVWQVPEMGKAESFGGVLSTEGDVVFYGSDDDAFTAADAKTGKILWRFQTSDSPHASPMGYEFDHKQYVVEANGPNILAFGLPE